MLAIVSSVRFQCRFFRLAVFDQLDGLHETTPAHVPNNVLTALHLFQAFMQLCTDRLCLSDHLVLFDYLAAIARLLGGNMTDMAVLLWLACHRV